MLKTSLRAHSRRQKGSCMEAASASYHRILLGQGLLCLCCIVYLIWWSVSFRPGQEVNRVGGARGILLLGTAALGIAGVYLSVMGLSALPKGAEKLSAPGICIAGAAMYVGLLAVTAVFFHRPVTTELLLITGWAMLEVCCVNTCRAGGALSVPQSIWMLLVIAAAFVISMVLYVLYYRMEEWRAFYAAMVPLITEAVSMGIFELVLRL